MSPISTQSLEVIVLIVAKSAGRISESCMHISMQIQVGSVSCTRSASHRPVRTRSHCSSLCYQGMGARITPPTPLFSHSTTLDNSESNSSNLQRLLVLLCLHHTTCDFPHFLSACRPAPKPNCRQNGCCRNCERPYEVCLSSYKNRILTLTHAICPCVDYCIDEGVVACVPGCHSRAR